MKKHKASVPGKYTQHTSINTNKASCITQPTSPAATNTFRWAMILLGTNSKFEVRNSSVRFIFFCNMILPRFLRISIRALNNVSVQTSVRGNVGIVTLGQHVSHGPRFRRSVLGGIESYE